MINASDTYLSIIYDELHRHLYDAKVLHADETPFEVIKDDRPAGTNSYMWVYRNGACEIDHPVVIYDYQPTRKTDHPDEFLKDFNGILVTDGYQAYHTLDKRRSNLQVAGCWVHAKRKFAELVKAAGGENGDGTIASMAVKRISRIFHLDNQFEGLPPDELLKQRQLVAKPKVDDFFKWAKDKYPSLPPESATAKAINYCLNQEQYLRVFLDNPLVPMDNNLAEQAIRPFTLGRKNWVNMYSTKGAKASAVIYSLVETAKANNLRVFEYLNLLLEELPYHMDDTDRSFLESLLPWSEHVKERCHTLQKS